MQPELLGHKFEGHGKSVRTDDVGSVALAVRFGDIFLPQRILSALNNAGFQYLSPVQAAALPAARKGRSLIATAKSGTGKTLIFVIRALEMIRKGDTGVQVIGIAPTREVAVQIGSILKTLAGALSHIRICEVIGGFSLREDVLTLGEKPNIVIGTPGRLRHLLTEGYLKLDRVQLIFFDEVDKLFSPKEDFLTDLVAIKSATGPQTQTICTTATLSRSLSEKLVSLNMIPEDHDVFEVQGGDVRLLGVKQCIILQDGTPSSNVVYNILLDVPHRQAIVFAESAGPAHALACDLCDRGISAAFLSGEMVQLDRMEILDLFRQRKLKVLVCTDLAARGIDISGVNLVINVGLSCSPQTYTHRVGRAGRFGGLAVAVSLCPQEESDAFNQAMGTMYGDYIQVIDPDDLQMFIADRKLNGMVEEPTSYMTSVSAAARISKVRFVKNTNQAKANEYCHVHTSDHNASQSHQIPVPNREIDEFISIFFRHYRAELADRIEGTASSSKQGHCDH
eukprot:Clim_evm5s234 gene=Clim_evmTU5s234